MTANRTVAVFGAYGHTGRFVVLSGAADAACLYANNGDILASSIEVVIDLALTS